MKTTLLVWLALIGCPLVSCGPISPTPPASSRAPISPYHQMMPGGFVGHPAANTMGLQSSR